MIKQGDLLYCKQEIIELDNNRNIKTFEIDKQYKVLAIVANIISIKTKYSTWTVYNFYNIKKGRTKNLQYLWDHFYTTKEIRLKKLKKLYNA
jgi:hypothetical protein